MYGRGPEFSLSWSVSAASEVNLSVSLLAFETIFACEFAQAFDLWVPSKAHLASTFRMWPRL